MTSFSSHNTHSTAAAPAWQPFSNRGCRISLLLAYLCSLPCLLNLNVFLQYFTLTQHSYTLMLLACCGIAVFLLRSTLQFLLASPIIWVLLALFHFFLVALVAGATSPYTSLTLAIERGAISRYGGILVILITGFCCGTASILFRKWHWLLLFLFAVSSLSPISAVVQQLIHPAERATGFVFLDPNEAGLYALFPLVLGVVLTINTHRRFWLLSGLAFSSYGVLTSFSKTAMLALLVLLFLQPIFLLRNRSISPHTKRYVSLVLWTAFIAYSLAFCAAASGRIGAFLTSEQQERMEALWFLLTTGTLDDTTTSLRFSIWRHCIDLWLEAPLLGHGLTSMDIVPGLHDRSPHNVFLVLLCEAGAVGTAPIVLSSLLVIGYSLLNCSEEIRTLSIGFLIIALFFCMSLSNAMWIRPLNFFAGCVLGLLTVSKWRHPSLPRMGFDIASSAKL